MSSQDALHKAAETGDLDGVRKAIADGADPKARDSDALRLAAENGHVECVRHLIPVSDPRAFYSDALILSAFNGHSECVNLLIPVSDPKAKDSCALRWSVVNGHVECVMLLVPVSDVATACARLKEVKRHDALALIDSISQEEVLRAKHLKRTSGRTCIGL